MLNKITKTIALQQQIKTLENKVEVLQQEIAISREEPTVWNELKQKLVNESMVSLIGNGGSWESMENILEGISIIFQEVLNLDYLNKLSDDDFEAANEFVEMILKFTKENYKLRFSLLREKKQA